MAVFGDGGLATIYIANNGELLGQLLTLSHVHITSPFVSQTHMHACTHTYKLIRQTDTAWAWSVLTLSFNGIAWKPASVAIYTHIHVCVRVHEECVCEGGPVEDLGGLKRTPPSLCLSNNRNNRK